MSESPAFYALALQTTCAAANASSEVASAPPSPKNVAKQARAIENMAYVVLANTVGIDGIGIPKASADGSVAAPAASFFRHRQIHAINRLIAEGVIV